MTPSFTPEAIRARDECRGTSWYGDEPSSSEDIAHLLRVNEALEAALAGLVSACTALKFPGDGRPIGVRMPSYEDVEPARAALHLHRGES